jgi:hypothetical protein
MKKEASKVYDSSGHNGDLSKINAFVMITPMTPNRKKTSTKLKHTQVCQPQQEKIYHKLTIPSRHPS